MNTNEPLTSLQAFSPQNIEKVVQADPCFSSIVDWFGLSRDEKFLPLLTSPQMSYHVDPFGEDRQSRLRQTFQHAATFIANKYAVAPFSPSLFYKEYGLTISTNIHVVNRFLRRLGEGELQPQYLPALTWSAVNWEAVAAGETGRACYHSPNDSFNVRLLTNELPQAYTDEASEQIAKLANTLNSEVVNRNKVPALTAQLAELKKATKPVKAFGRSYATATLSANEKNAYNGTWVPLCSLPMVFDKSAKPILVEGVMKACSIAPACMKIGLFPVAILGCSNWRTRFGISEHFRVNDRQPTRAAAPIHFTPTGEKRETTTSYFLADANASNGLGIGSGEVYAAVRGLSRHIRSTGGDMRVIRFFKAGAALPEKVSGVDDYYREKGLNLDEKIAHLQWCLKSNEIPSFTLPDTPVQSQAGCVLYLTTLLKMEYEDRVKRHFDEITGTSLYYYDDTAGWEKFFPTDDRHDDWTKTNFGNYIYQSYATYVDNEGEKSSKTSKIVGGASTYNMTKSLQVATGTIPLGLPLRTTKPVSTSANTEVSTLDYLIPVKNGYIVPSVLANITKKYDINTFRAAVLDVISRKNEWYLDQRSPHIFQSFKGHSVDMRYVREFQTLTVPHDMMNRMDVELPHSGVKLLVALGRPLLSDTPWAAPLKKLILLQGDRDSGKTTTLGWIFRAMGTYNNMPLNYAYDFESIYQTEGFVHSKYIVMDEFNAMGGSLQKEAEMKQFTGGSPLPCRIKYKSNITIDPQGKTLFAITNDLDSTPFRAFEDVLRRTCLLTLNSPPTAILKPVPDPTPAEAAQFFVEALVAGMMYSQGSIDMENSPAAENNLQDMARSMSRGTVTTAIAQRLLRQLFMFQPCRSGDPDFDDSRPGQGMTLREIQDRIEEYRESAAYDPRERDVNMRNNELINALRVFVENQTKSKVKVNYRLSTRDTLGSVRSSPTYYKVRPKTIKDAYAPSYKAAAG